jgi:hypothetical protein
MNPAIVSLLEILKYTVPALVVLLSSYLIVKKFLVSEIQRKQIALLREGQDVTQRLRLQAYERLVLLMERIHPRNLTSRVYEPGMTAAELQAALTLTIRTEWEHNLSQQIYVSRQVWETVRGVKEQEIHMVNQLAGQLKPEATAADLHRRIVDAILSESGELPTEVALQIINDEARKVLSLGAVG